jgi:hypothetical protein
MFVMEGSGAGQEVAENPRMQRYATDGVEDWGRFGLRSQRGPPQLHLQLQQRTSFASAPSSSTPSTPVGTRAVAEPRAEAQVMKPGPKKFFKSKLMALSSSSEEDPLWEGSQPDSDQGSSMVKQRKGRPREGENSVRTCTAGCSFQCAQNLATNPECVWSELRRD